jgi:hypothetical protein
MAQEATEAEAEALVELLKDGTIQIVNGIYSDDLDGKSAVDILIVAQQRLEGLATLLRQRTGGVH